MERSSAYGPSAQVPEVLGLLKKDHDAVKEMFQQFAELSERALESDRQQAAIVAQQVLQELRTHAELEAQIVYPSLRRQDEALFHEASEEHHVADLLIDELQRMRPQDPSYRAKMLVLKMNVEHHIREEETGIFDRIRELPEETLSEAAKAWKSRKVAAR